MIQRMGLSQVPDFRRAWTLCAAIGAIGVGAIGCGDGASPLSAPRYPVSGAVTFRGKPVSEGKVIFYRSQVGSITAKIDKAGAFVFDEAQGVPAGDYRVGLAPPEVYEIPPRPHPTFPDKYRFADTSGLTATVKSAGDNLFTFDMQ